MTFSTTARQPAGGRIPVPSRAVAVTRRAQSYRAAPRRRAKAPRRWYDLLTSNVVPLLALAGITVYAVLSIPYAIFYHDLGVGLDDVGFSYPTVLVSSVGPLLIAVAFSPLVWFVIGLIWESSGRDVTPRAAIVIAFIALIFTLGAFLPFTAYVNSRQVKGVSRSYVNSSLQRFMHRKQRLLQLGNLERLLTLRN
jgi:hypothetical protein